MPSRTLVTRLHHTHIESGVIRICTAACISAFMVFQALVTTCRADSPQPQKRTEIVATVLPAYLAATNVCADVPGLSVRMLLDPALGCPHSYSLTPDDRRALEQAATIVAIGAGMEGFLDKLRRQLPGDPIVALADACKLKETACDHTHGADDHAHEHAVNPHAWLSPDHYIRMVERLGEKLAAQHTAHAARFRENQAEYVKRLQVISRETAALAEKIGGAKVVAGEAVEYLLDDLKLEIVAMLPGHEGEGESASQLLRISRTIRHENPAAIVVESGRKDRVAATLAKEHGLPLIELDALVTCDRTDPPRDHYEAAMRRNLAALARVGAAR